MIIASFHVLGPCRRIDHKDFPGENRFTCCTIWSGGEQHNIMLNYGERLEIHAPKQDEHNE